MEADDNQDWGQLPSAILCTIFDTIFTAPSAHPSWLAVKAQSYARLNRVCKAWKTALAETPIGVCLPAEVPPAMRRWVCSITLRGVEFHDPEHTRPEVVAILSDPQLIGRSGRSILSIVDAPYDGSWRPSDFPNVFQLVVWRAGRTSALWDVRRISSLSKLTYLVLASGFSGMRHMEAWPPGCKRLVWTCPSDAHSSRLSMPAVPPNISLQWVSLRAYAVRLHDLDGTLGRVSELVVHAAYIFVHVPRTRYRSLTTLSPALPPSRTGSSGTVSSLPASLPGVGEGSQAVADGSASVTGGLVQQGVAAAPHARRGGGGTMGPGRDIDWAEEGLAAMAAMFVEEPTLLTLRLKFARLLVSQPLSGVGGGPNQPGTSAGDGPPDEGGGGGGTSMGGGAQHARPMCHSCGRPRALPTRRAKRRPRRDGGDGSSEGEEEGDGDEEGSEVTDDEEEEEVEMVYDEVTPDQVVAAFRAAIRAYAEVIAVRAMGRDGSAAPAPLPALPRAGGGGSGVRGRGEDGDSTVSVADLSMVVPLLETGKIHPGQDREVSITRKHADPSEPARIKLDQPTNPGGPRLEDELPSLLRSTRPVQCLVFAPWPYPAGADTNARDDDEDKDEDGGGGGGDGDGDRGSGAPVVGSGSAGAGGSDAAAGSGASKSNEGSGSDPDRPLTSRHASELQHALLKDPRFQAASADVLRKVNWVLLPAWLPPGGARDMFAPYLALSKVSIVILGDASEFTTPILPVSVVKVQFTAGSAGARFNAGCISNLTEMWRLTLSGFHSFDLSAIPAVRPGFVLKIIDTPASRMEPLGHRSRDALMPEGHIVDMNVQMGTDAGASNSSTPLTRVALSSWAPLCRDLHIRCPPGAELHVSGSTIPAIFARLSRCRLEQFTVCLATGAGGDVVVGPEAQAAAVAGGQQPPPVFAFVTSSGARIHGVTLAVMVQEGLVPDWQVEIMDAGDMDDEEGMLYFTFFRRDAGPDARRRTAGTPVGAAAAAAAVDQTHAPPTGAAGSSTSAAAAAAQEEQEEEAAGSGVASPYAVMASIIQQLQAQLLDGDGDAGGDGGAGGGEAAGGDGSSSLLDQLD